MTEREILKRLVRQLRDHDVTWAHIVPIVDEAAKVLAQTTDPEPEHPAVEAYRKWCNSMKPGTYSMAEGFLAGWRQALHWASEQPYFEHKSGGTGETVLRDYAAKTPTQLS